jgi:PAS domain S-box-containing protein
MLNLLSYLWAAAGGAAIAGFAVFLHRRAAYGAQERPANDPSSGLALPRQTLAELQRFRAVVDTCVDAIYMVDRETLKFVDATATASSRTGYSHEELMQMGPLDLLKESREELIRSYDAAIAAGAQGIRTESTGRLKDGRKTFLELNRQAVRIDGRWIIVTISRDVTERKNAELAAQRFARMFAVLSDTNEAIMRVSSPEDLFQHVCEAAVHGGRLKAASVCVPSESSGDAKIVAVAGEGADALRDAQISIDDSTAVGRGLVGTAFRTQAPCISNDFQNDSRTGHWHEAARRAGIAAGAALPLVKDGRTTGILLLHSAEKNAFDDEVVQLLMHMGRNVVFAVDNFKRESERKVAEEQLHAADARLKRATRGANDGLWELDVPSREMWVSERFAEMFGYDQREFLGARQTFFDILHAEDAARLREAIERCIRDEALVDVEVRATTRAGEVRWYRVRGALERSADGVPLTVSGSQRDINQRQQYALALL